MEAIINKVAESGLLTLNLEDFLPKTIKIFDIKEFLFMGLILKEKDFRTALMAYPWEEFRNASTIITCSADAIIPVWAYMLVAQYLEPVAKEVRVGGEEACKEQIILNNIDRMDILPYTDKRLVIKGCGDIPIPDSAYALVTFKLKPVAKSIMYGEPCSTVPIYKKKTI